MSLQGFVMKIPIFIMNVMTNGPGGLLWEFAFDGPKSALRDAQWTIFNIFIDK